jgi:hypothetical protein
MHYLSLPPRLNELKHSYVDKDEMDFHNYDERLRIAR